MSKGDHSVTKTHIYRKTLPSLCIDFASTEGRVIFKEAINGDYMVSYFHLAAQFRTQDEPAFCGLTTLVMALNALSVDPGRVWKGPWRWYHEDMLDCCVPLPVAKKEGINIYQFCCLAKCNGLDANMVHATQDMSLESFREAVRSATQHEDEVFVCSYSRKMLGQSGDGHFSPIGGYHAERDLVLIFDVARFKYPPHWVTVEVLWKAMQGMDQKTGQPRGYFELKRTSKTGISTELFKLSKNLELLLCCSERKEILGLTNKWWEWLREESQLQNQNDDFLRIFVSTFVDLWCPHGHDETMQLLETNDQCSCVIYSDNQSMISSLVGSLQDQRVYQLVEECLEAKKCRLGTTLSQINEQCGTAVTLPKTGIAHHLTMILLSWPYQTSTGFTGKRQNTVLASQYVCDALKNAHKSLQLEVEVLRAQFDAIFCYCCTAEMTKANQRCYRLKNDAIM